MSSLIFPLSIAIVLCTIAGILTTGAFHEDGFADVCDGFGGGWTKDKILMIMKDSAIGAYGAIGIILLIGLKCLALFSLSEILDIKTMILVLLTAHSISRANAMLMIFTDEYARSNDDAKAKPVAKKMSGWSLAFGLMLGILPLVAFQEYKLLAVIPVLLLLKWRLSIYYHKWIEGYTGDCLGTVQQLSEVVFYLFILAACKFI